MANFSHAACSHPSTKVARAACRRDMARAAAAPKIESPIITAWEGMKAGPLELTAAPVKTASAVVTRENWREYKGETVTATLTGERVVEGTVTGWSANLLQIKGEKLVRVPVAEVESVTV